MADLFDDLMRSPLAILDHPLDEAFRLSTSQITQFQDYWIAKRFADLRPRVAMLDKLAKEQGIGTVSRIDDAAPLLLPHTVYKSYPMSYLENYRFDKLTKWLSGLTSSDLSRVDAVGIESIDDWIDELDAKTDLMLTHTSGTTGKLSFLPRNVQQSRDTVALYSNMWRDFRGANTGPDMLANHMPMINPGYRYGAGMGPRMSGLQVEMLAGGDDNALFLYNERLSADVLSLSGRIRVAEAKGELGALKIPPALLRRRDDFIAREKNRPQAMAAFFETARTKYAGKDVYIGALYGMFYDWAVDGLAKGHRKIFGANSFASIGGGKKGRVFPDGWRDTIEEFLGLPLKSDIYAMSECTIPASLCSEDRYHFPPLAVPYLLDPRTGAVLPRKDGTIGRLALYDLLPDSYWAGFISGDEVTAGGWEKPCACGRTGFYTHSDIRRYSEKEGGDDKIMCSGAPEAHDNAISFLAEFAQ